MPQTTIINNFGNVIGWNQHELVLFGRTVEGIQKIMYKDSVEREAIMAGGKYPVGVGEGNYKAECGITLLLEEVQAIMASMPAGTRIQDIPPTDISVLTIRGGVVKKDVIRNFQFVGQGKDVKQGDKSVPVEMPCFCTHIDWNVQ